MISTRWVDDPSLPCSLCCRVEVDEQGFWADGAFTAYGVDGQFLPAIGNGTHRACQDAVTAMHAQQESERLDGGETIGPMVQSSRPEPT